MALNDAAAVRAMGIWLDGFDPPLSTEARERMIDGEMTRLVKAICQVIREDAVVTPVGTPPMTIVDGDDVVRPVVGVGRIT